jgi:hypothetical protein
MLILIDCISGPLKTGCESLEISGHCDRFSRILCGGCSAGECNNTFLYESDELGTDLDGQINIVFRLVYFTLKRLWTTVSLTPVGTQLQLAWSLVLSLFLYCNVIFPRWLWGCVTGCDWHIVLVLSYRATLLVYWLFHWVGTSASGYAVRCTS